MAENKKSGKFKWSKGNLVVQVYEHDMDNPAITELLTGRRLREALINGVENLKTLGYSYAEIAKILGYDMVTIVPIKDEEDGEE